MTDELLFKYISGQAGQDEVKYVQDWSGSSEMRKNELSRIKNIWVLSGLNNKIDLNVKEAEIQKIWAKVRELNRQEKKRILRVRWVKYAAAIILLIGLSGAAGMFISKYYSTPTPKYAEIIVPNGERSTIILPDGSTVKLNSGSQLKFPSDFSSGKRQVILQGEGFFDVTHDKSNPFIVVASDIRVEVLGTRFNISCYPNDEIIETYLESGKVKVNLNDKKHDSILMNPLDALQFNKTTGKYLRYTLKDSRLSDWTKGILTVKGETIEQLAKKLERRFDVKIFFSDDEVKKHIYTGSIKDEELRTVLEALKFASSLNYEINGGIVTLFSK